MRASLVKTIKRTLLYLQGNQAKVSTSNSHLISLHSIRRTTLVSPSSSRYLKITCLALNLSKVSPSSSSRCLKTYLTLNLSKISPSSSRCPKITYLALNRSKRKTSSWFKGLKQEELPSGSTQERLTFRKISACGRPMQPTDFVRLDIMVCMQQKS